MGKCLSVFGWPCVLWLLAWIISGFLLLPSHVVWEREAPHTRYRIENLRAITAYWLGNFRGKDFPLDEARKDLPVRPSAWSEADLIWKIEKLRWAAVPWGTGLLSGPLVFASALAHCSREKMRRVFRVAVGLMIGLSMLCFVVLLLPGLASSFWPGSHAYLDDYSFVTSPNWDAPPDKLATTIIAYEKKPIGLANWRIVSCIEGGAAPMNGARFRELMAEQGHELENPASSDEGG